MHVPQSLSDLYQDSSSSSDECLSGSMSLLPRVVREVVKLGNNIRKLERDRGSTHCRMYILF